MRGALRRDDVLGRHLALAMVDPPLGTLYGHSVVQRMAWAWHDGRQAQEAFDLLIDLAVQYRTIPVYAR